MLFKNMFAILAMASTVLADQGSIRVSNLSSCVSTKDNAPPHPIIHSSQSRGLTNGPDRRAGNILDCFLVNLDSKVEIKLDGDDDYTPSDSSEGWSIYCKTEKPGKV